jgi:hypothetical protein
MSVKIPNPINVDLDLAGSLGSVGPVTIDGIPKDFTISIEKIPKIDIGLDNIGISVDKLPKLQVGLDPVTINPITLNPLSLDLSIKSLPSVRTHLPADYSAGISILGIELFSFRLCGEGQIITEPYRPNPCERCGGGFSVGDQHVPVGEPIVKGGGS